MKPHRSLNADENLLVPMFAHTERATATESGGVIYPHQDALAAKTSMARPKSPLVCYFCQKVYKRQYYLKQHIRKWHRVNSGSVAVSDYNTTMSTSSAHTATSATGTAMFNAYRYRCTVADCDEAFATKLQMRDHRQLAHLLKCSACDELCPTADTLDWHQRSCKTLHRQALLQRVEDDATEAASTVSSTTADEDGERRHVGRTRAPCRQSLRIRLRRESEARSIVTSAASSSSSRSRLSRRRLSEVHHLAPQVDPMMRVHDWREQNNMGSGESELQSVSSATRRLSLAGSALSEMRHRSASLSRDANIWKQRRADRKASRRDGQKLFQCHYDCAFGTHYLRELAQHELTEHNDPLLYHCEACDEWFTTNEYLVDHKVNHFWERMYVCILCNDKFNNMYSLQSHLQMHQKAHKKFSCKSCQCYFISAQSLAAHVDTGHSYSVIKERRKSMTIVPPVMTTDKSKFTAGLKKDMTERNNLIQANRHAAANRTPNMTTNTFEPEMRCYNGVVGTVSEYWKKWLAKRKIVKEEPSLDVESDAGTEANACGHDSDSWLTIDDTINRPIASTTSKRSRKSKKSKVVQVWRIAPKSTPAESSTNPAIPIVDSSAGSSNSPPDLHVSPEADIPPELHNPYDADVEMQPPERDRDGLPGSNGAAIAVAQPAHSSGMSSLSESPSEPGVCRHLYNGVIGTTSAFWVKRLAEMNKELDQSAAPLEDDVTFTMSSFETARRPLPVWHARIWPTATGMPMIADRQLTDTLAMSETPLSYELLMCNNTTTSDESESEDDEDRQQLASINNRDNQTFDCSRPFRE